MDAIGPDLYNLVQHLYRTKSSASDAIAELTFRSHERCELADVQMAPTAREIAYTRWFASMKNRYKVLREELLSKPEVGEAEEVLRELYAGGCTVSQISEAFRNATDMLTFRIPEDLLNEAIQQRVALLESRSVQRLTTKELSKEFVSNVVIPSLMPERWWEKQPDAAKKALLKLRAVGFRTEPPSLVLEYEREGAGGNKKRRHRTIYLHEALNPTGSTLQLSRKLLATHGSLLGEDALQKYLYKLQKLVKQGATLSTSPTNTKVASSATSTISAVAASAAQARAGPNKADLGLLYRDPEAALKNVDLQDADEFTVKEFKNKMNEAFDANAVKPGDAGYAYDRRRDFKATKKSEWDDDDDEDDF